MRISILFTPTPIAWLRREGLRAWSGGNSGTSSPPVHLSKENPNGALTKHQ